MTDRPLIIEMVGVAGAGKSTLREILRQRDGTIQFRVPPQKIGYLPFLIKQLFTRPPIYFFKNRTHRCFTWEEIKIMAYLETWIPHLQKQAAEKDIVCVLDPGSVYWLTTIREFGPESARRPKMVRWWNEKLRQWGQALGLIIWLDAPDELLLHRVLTRDEWHPVKTQSPEETLEQFSRLRKGYEEIIDLMTSQGGPPVLKFRTDQMAPKEIADRVFAEAKLNAATC